MKGLLLTVAILLLATSIQAYTYPEGLDLELSRLFPGHLHQVGVPIHVQARFANQESVALSSFYYSEQFPDWISVFPGGILIDGEATDFIFEVGEPGDAIPGKIPYRWILDDPDGGGNRELLESGEELAIYYILIASREGELSTNLDGWFGMLLEGEGFAVMGSDAYSPLLYFYSDITGEPAQIPAGVQLAPACPNPFNPVTRLSFSTGEECDLCLDILDARGRWIVRLADGLYPAGTHSLSWNGRDDRGGSLPSGVYFVRLSGEGFTPQTQKLLLLK